MLEELAEPLLSWYDGHARILPWREEPPVPGLGFGNHAAADQSGGSEALL